MSLLDRIFLVIPYKRVVRIKDMSIQEKKMDVFTKKMNEPAIRIKD